MARGEETYKEAFKIKPLVRSASYGTVVKIETINIDDGPGRSFVQFFYSTKSKGLRRGPAPTSRASGEVGAYASNLVEFVK